MYCGMAGWRDTPADDCGLDRYKLFEEELNELRKVPDSFGRDKQQGK
jgi:hypothetical protein